MIYRIFELVSFTAKCAAN